LKDNEKCHIPSRCSTGRQNWIEALCREIDTLKFASAFDTFTPDAILAFGVKQITGASAMQAFFVKIDSPPLNIDHRILEVWDGEMTTYVRGEAEMAKQGGTEHQCDGDQGGSRSDPERGLSGSARAMNSAIGDVL
jgi:hypothetical protein